MGADVKQRQKKPRRVRKAKDLRLDLACGQSPKEGFTGVDIWDEAAVVHDLTVYPWPWEDNSAAELHCSHYVEHIPYDVLYDGKLKDGLCAFMDEAWRILRNEGVFTIIHPFLKSERAFQDPTHRRFIPAATWHYFSKGWREATKLDHYPLSCDFEVVQIAWGWLDPQTQLRSEQYQQHTALRDWDVIADLVVTLKARKP